MTIAVPRQPTITALEALAATLDASPGIEWASLAMTSSRTNCPRPMRQSSMNSCWSHAFPRPGTHGIWSSMRQETAGGMRQLRPGSRTSSSVRRRRSSTSIPPCLPSHQELPHFSPSPPDESINATHGYDVTLMLAARFNPPGRTGANPFSDCLDITGVQDRSSEPVPGDRSDRAELSGREVHPQLLAQRRKHLRGCAVPPAQGAVIVPCQPRHFGRVVANTISSAAVLRLIWKAHAYARWYDFLVTSVQRATADSETEAMPSGARDVGCERFHRPRRQQPDPSLGFAADPVLRQPAIADWPRCCRRRTAGSPTRGTWSRGTGSRWSRRR